MATGADMDENTEQVEEGLTPDRFTKHHKAPDRDPDSRTREDEQRMQALCMIRLTDAVRR